MRWTVVLILAVTGAVAGSLCQANAKTTDQAEPNEAAGAPTLDPDVDKLFVRFGLFGSWAQHCERKATPANPHVRITNPSPGAVLEDQDFGAGYSANRYSVVAAAAQSPTRLAVEAIFQPGKPDEQRQWLVYEIRHGTRRTLYNRTGGGAVRVKDGVVLAAGTRTPMLRKCR